VGLVEGAVQREVVDVVEESKDAAGGVRFFIEVNTETLDDLGRGDGTR